MCSFEEVAVRLDREEVGVTQDRELSFEAEQVSFGGAIELPPLGHCVSTVTFGDMARDRERRRDDGVAGRLGLAPGAVAHGAEHFAAEGDRFLPDLEIANPGGHGGQDGRGKWLCDIKPTHHGTEPCRTRRLAGRSSLCLA